MQKTSHEHLLGSSRTKTLIVEFTSRCNLRCAYCAVSQPGYVGTRFSLEHFDALTKLILDRRPEIVMVNGHGETTTIKNWDRYCRTWLDHGLNLKIITNLAKELSDDEVETLARFRILIFSVDTADPELFELLRRGARFEVFKTNLSRISAAASRQPEPPDLTFSAVVMDVNALILPEFVKFGMAHGVRYFEFCNLAKYPSVEGATPLRHVAEMPFKDRQKISRRLEKMFKKMRKAGVEFIFPEAIREALKAPPEKPSAETQEEGVCNTKSSRQVYPPAVPEGETKMTRSCLDPWEFCFIQTNATVRLCCFSEEIIGDLGTGKSLGELLDGEKAQVYREGLLSGDLHEPCKNCWARSWVPTDQLQQEVENSLKRKEKRA